MVTEGPHAGNIEQKKAAIPKKVVGLVRPNFLIAKRDLSDLATSTQKLSFVSLVGG